MKLYKTPTKTTVTIDAARILEDLRKSGTLYFPKAEFPAVKSLVAYMRHAGLLPLRPTVKTVTFIEGQVEVEVLKVTLLNTAVRQNTRKDTCKVVRISDKVVFDSLNLAIQATTMPLGAKSSTTVQRKIDAGMSMFEASKGTFTLTTEVV